MRKVFAIIIMIYYLDHLLLTKNPEVVFACNRTAVVLAHLESISLGGRWCLYKEESYHLLLLMEIV